MDENRLSMATALANRDYSIEVVLDYRYDGSVVYHAFNNELKGCSSIGDSIQNSIDNLLLARIDYIYTLLEDGLPVPEPNTGNPCMIRNSDAL